MIITVATLTNITNLQDIELLERLCSSDDDDLLYSQFLNRFLPDVEKECSRICNSRKLDSHVGKQIAHETFERVRKYKSFTKDQIKLANERKAIIVYLNRISLSLFNDFYNNEHKKEIVHKTYFDDIISPDSQAIDVKDLKKKKDLALLIFKKLNKKEQTILLADIEHKRHQKYLPDNVLDNLAKDLNIKRDTVRKIRERAIQKIKQAIDEINEN